MAPKKGASYYKTIKGVRYDKQLLEQAEKAAKDSPVSEAEAKALWTSAQDGNVVTKTEQRTLRYAMKEMKFAEAASAYLEKELKGLSTGTSYYKEVGGVKYDRELFEAAAELAKSGTQISLTDAKDLWEQALDGSGVTQTEAKTLEYALKEHKWSAPAKKYIEEQLAKVTKKADDTPAEEKKEEEKKDDDDSGEDIDEPAKPAEKSGDVEMKDANGGGGKALSPEERERRKREKEQKRKADKRKKNKENKKKSKEADRKEKLIAFAQGKGPAPAAKGKPQKGPEAKAKAKAAEKKEDNEDDIEIDYVVPEVLEGMDDAFQSVKERFTPAEPEEKDEDNMSDDGEDKPKKRSKPKTSLLEEAEDSDNENDDDGEPKSKKSRKLGVRMSVAELKTLVKRPDVVEVWDTTSIDPKLLVYLKAYRNTCSVPRHWCSKRRYMAGKRGVEKPPFKLPEYIEATGISKIRQAIMERISEQSLKAKNREKMHPKMGKLDIDYQVLHDAFFKFAKKPPLTRHNDMYYEGKEYEAKMMTKRPGQLSAAIKEALGMAEDAPPPWLINMQRYGPPPAYPGLKIPGLNAPIPQGAEYGYHPGGWGKPPVDEFGNPLYGDWRQDQAPTPAAPEDTTLWGEVEDFDDDDDDEDGEGGVEKDGMATPMLGTQTPLIGTGSATPVMSRDGGTRSISGVSSITSGLDTPGAGGSRGKRGGIASVSGISSASLTPTPQLFQVLEEQKARSSKGMFPSSQSYKVRSRGSATPMAGVGSSGTGTPIAGIGTPIGGIGTPHGISTPHGIGTPGMGTPGIGTRTPHGYGTPGIGTRTPHGIGTPHGVSTPQGYGTRTPGVGTPIGGIGTPHVGGISTPIGGIATPVGGIATPVGGIATPVGGIATPVGGIATPVGGIATPVGGIATPTGLPGNMAPTPLGGADTPGPVTMSLNPQDVETEGILTADIIRQQLKQHEEAAAKAKLAAGQKEVAPRGGAKEGKKKKDKSNKFKF